MNSRKRYNNKINVSGEKIRATRETKGLSREKLSSRLLLELNIDIPVSSLVKIENNTRTIVNYELWGIAKILCVDMKDLIKI